MGNHIQSGDAVRDGLEAIFPRIWRYCVALTGSRQKADDLAQASCLRALEKSNLYKAGTHLDRWMFTLTQRLWINELRKDAIRTGGGLSSVEDANLLDTRPDPETNSIGREVFAGVMELPEAQRATVVLVYAEGYSYRDAAEILDIPVGTVMSRLAAARRKLADEFGEGSEQE